MGASRQDSPAQRRSAATLYTRLKGVAVSVAKRRPGALGADYSLEDLHHWGFMAANEVLQEIYGGVLGIPDELQAPVLKHLAAVGFIAMDHKCIDRLRHRAVEARHVADETFPDHGVRVSDIKVPLDKGCGDSPESGLVVRDALANILAEHEAFFRVALVADQQTREAFGRELKMTPKAVARTQLRLSKKFKP